MIKNRSGQALSEYLILTLLIATASIIAVQSIGKSVFNKLNLIQDNIQREVTIESVRNAK